MKPKIVVISTGGTIAMRFDADKNGMVPAVSGNALIEAVPPLKDICDIEVIDFSNIDSSDISPKHMHKLASLVDRELSRDDVSGIVITHGTDTIEETAYFLDLSTQHAKPICLTAAMRTLSELSSDGPNNLLSAVRVAVDKKAWNYGVMVVMNNEVHAAVDVTKMHTVNVNTFDSPFWGPIGYVDSDCVIMHQTPRPRHYIQAEHVNSVVPILKAYTGIEQIWLEAMLEQPIDGLVIDGFGRGNFPSHMMPAIQKLLERDIPVVVTTRVLGGRVLDVYAVTGGGSDLKQRGAILAGELSCHKARLKLILALGKTKNIAEIKSCFI